ncbi:MAG: hypothetical protein Tsb009_05620 [Planctomycetaceae bacterium]
MSNTAKSFRDTLKRQHAEQTSQNVKLTEDALRLDLGHVESLKTLGESAFTQNRPEEALRYFTKAVEANATDPQIYFHLGQVQERLNQPADAAKSYEHAIHLKPDFLQPHLRLACVLTRAGQPVDAVTVYRKALQLNPETPEVYHELGKLLWELGEQDGAIACFRSALVLIPDNVEAHCHLATVLRARGELEEAIEHLQQAVKLRPDDSDIACLQGKVFVDAGRPTEAIRAFGLAIEKNPKSCEAYYRLGLLLKDREEYGAARNCLESAIAIEPSHIAARTALGMVQLLRGDSDAGLTTMQEAVQRHPNSAEAQRGLGHALKELKRFQEAVVAYEHSLTIEPDSVVTRYMLAKTLHQLGRYEEAITHFERAARLSPESAQIHYHHGNALKNLGRFEDAIAAYQTSLKFKPDCAHSHYDLGNVYRHLRDFEAAKNCYEEALNLQPDDPTILLSLGNVLKSMDDLGAATIAYRKVIRLLPEKTRWELWIATLCPAVFESNAAIDEYRESLRVELERLADAGISFELEEISNAACPVPYNLQFHGRDDLPLKQAYAQVYSQGFPTIEPRLNREKPRVGIVVTEEHEGVFLRYLGDVLKQLDSNLFDTVVVCAAAGEQRIRKHLASDHIQTLVIPSRFDRMLNTIREGAFDVLYYWEVGSDVDNYFLPFFRLAPVQCTSAGVPVTTGTPCMDYFLSNDFIEVANADSHYSEQLVRAQSLLTCQPRMTLSDRPKTREQFGFGHHQNIYLCPHKIQKFHPDLDALFHGILQNDPDGTIVIPADRQGYMARKLMGRLERKLPDVFHRIQLLPHQTLDDYLSLTAAADVLLDPVHYGGGLTAFDGFSLNKVIVTLPTQFVRGRYTAGFYRKMNISAPIASTPEEYINIAVRMGRDLDWRKSVEARIQEASDVLFNSRDAVRDYEQIFLAMIEEARSQGLSGSR